jgi:D-hydroxyproline dehydrogenase subunit gamma
MGGSVFRRLPEAGAAKPAAVTVFVEDEAVAARPGDSVAAVMLTLDRLPYLRETAVGGAPRNPYCMMGVCFDCLVEIDGAPNRQGCMVAVRDGMRIRRQRGRRSVAP